MVALDGVGDYGQADLVHRAMPAASGVVGAGLDGLIYLGIDIRLVLTLVPAEAAKGAQILGDFLLGVVTEAVFERAEVLVEQDVRLLVDPCKIGVDCLSVVAHVGAVGKEKQALGPFALRDKAVPQLELAILGVGAAEGPVHVNAVGHGGHGEEAIAQAPYLVVVLCHGAHCIAARIGGVIPGAVVVYCPVHELQVAV